MKCFACDYEYEFQYLKGSVGRKVLKGDEEFIIVFGTFLIYSEQPYSDDKKEINIYMCPKCKTLRGDY